MRLRFAYRLTNSSADAEDIVQECFLSFLRPGRAYDPGRTPIRAYLYGAVRHQERHVSAGCMKRLERCKRGDERTDSCERRAEAHKR